MDGPVASESSEQLRALIAIGSSHHTPTLAAASQIAVALINAGFIVDLGNAAMRAMPAPPDYDLVVVGMTGRHGYDREVLRWLADYAPVLDTITSGAFLLGSTRRCVRSLVRFAECGWQPLETTALPDLPLGRDDNMLIERFVKRMTALTNAAVEVRLQATPLGHRTTHFDA
jgi:hypothetical protein